MDEVELLGYVLISLTAVAWFAMCLGLDKQDGRADREGE